MSSRGGYAPSTLRILASLIPQDLNIIVEFLDENIAKIDFEKITADLVGISVLTANAPRAYQISDNLRQRGMTVVLGGYHVTAMPEEALNHCDAVVVGFAENSWPKLVRDFISGNLQKIYNENFAEAFIGHKPLLSNPPNYKKQYLLPNTLEISRGCYHNCSFCVIPSSGNRYVQKPIASVIEEINFFKSKKIVFIDFSPFEDKEYALELFKAIKALKVKWYSNLTAKNAGNKEFIAKAAESGCAGVLIGFETINPDALSSGNKKFNHPENYLKIVTHLHQHKILVLGSFIFGFDEDDKTIFQNTLDFIKQSKIDLIHYAILTPFPGTKLFKQFTSENRITSFDWSKYDGTHVVFQPAKMTPAELQTGYFDIYQKSHSFPAIIRRTTHDTSHMMIKLAANLGFRLYLHSFIKQYKRGENNL
jgi:radical SAM superfamily enzyme YgiQ (UPF0313 family)